MGYISAIRKYFTGESREATVAKFEELENIIDIERADIKALVKGLNDILSNVDSIKKSANIVIEADGSTAESVAIALDNIRFSNSNLLDHVEGFHHSIKSHSGVLQKAQKDMADLISNNPNIATIICDVNHDRNLEKALNDVFDMYKSGNVSKDMAIAAYKSAMNNRRTDIDFTSVLDKNLKDNGITV